MTTTATPVSQIIWFGAEISDYTICQDRRLSRVGNLANYSSYTDALKASAYLGKAVKAEGISVEIEGKNFSVRLVMPGAEVPQYTIKNDAIYEESAEDSEA